MTSEKFPNQGELNIYTDGGKMSGNRVGAAYIFFEVTKQVQVDKFRLPEHSTVFQAEIKAIYKAAAALKETQKYKYVRFFIDSQAAIKALDSRTVTSRLVLDTINELNDASKNRQIRLYWTKAHTGTTGNELADQAAKEGRRLALVEAVAMPKIELTNKIMDCFYELWDSQWQAYSGARMTKQFYPKPDKKQAKHVHKLGRIELSRF